MSAKEKDSNELLNILMIIIGIMFVLKGIFELMASIGLLVPDWIGNLAAGANTAAALSMFGAQGMISSILGFWCLVAGIGLFREEEYALGMGLVVLSIMGIMGVSTMVGWFTGATFDFAYWPNYITIIATIVGIIGFFWLLVTYKRYD